MPTIANGQQKIFFLDAPGGCGKTFLIEIILAAVRRLGKIIIATTTSGLAATQLSGGKTFHSTFKVPLNVALQETPMCSVKKQSVVARF